MKFKYEKKRKKTNKQTEREWEGESEKKNGNNPNNYLVNDFFFFLLAGILTALERKTAFGVYDMLSCILNSTNQQWWISQRTLALSLILWLYPRAYASVCVDAISCSCTFCIFKRLIYRQWHHNAWGRNSILNILMFRCVIVQRHTKKKSENFSLKIYLLWGFGLIVKCVVRWNTVCHYRDACLTHALLCREKTACASDTRLPF